MLADPPSGTGTSTYVAGFGCWEKQTLVVVGQVMWNSNSMSLKSDENKDRAYLLQEECLSLTAANVEFLDSLALLGELFACYVSFCRILIWHLNLD